MKNRVLLFLATLAVSSAGCGSEAPAGPRPPDHEWTAEARASFPDAMALHSGVIARSCGPANGVCHNGKEFPDLHTVGNFVTAVSKPCNLDVDDPATVFDGCEPNADELALSGGSGFVTRIGYLGPDEYDPQTGTSFRILELEDPAPSTTSSGSGSVLRNGVTLLELPNVIETEEGSRHGRLVNTYMLDYPTYLLLQTVEGGDPNGNGVFGASLGWAEVVPGHPERSYLIGRVTGTVPGSRMPLANQALSNPEYVALFCWIESIGKYPKPEDRIDYDRCDFARDPIAYAIE